MIVAPPLEADTVQETITSVYGLSNNKVAVTAVGAEGTVAGVTGAEATDGEDEPNMLDATTVKVYAWPFVRPVAVTDVKEPDVSKAAGFEVTLYLVIGEPPLYKGTLQLTLACWDAPRTATTFVGASGPNAGTIVLEGNDSISATAVTETTVKK